MKAEVAQLHSQLHYWQNVTINILKDNYASLNTGIYTLHKLTVVADILILMQPVDVAI